MGSRANGVKVQVSELLDGYVRGWVLEPDRVQIMPFLLPSVTLGKSHVPSKTQHIHKKGREIPCKIF